MEIPLRQFEQYIDDTILKRGLKYFKDGLVNPPEEITPGKYEAIVEGTENYTVDLEIKNEIIREYNCTCPYDLGPVCKHVVAVIFYLQQEELNLSQNPKKRKPTQTTRKKKTVSEQVNEVLGTISFDDLKQFVREQSEHNPPFRNIFLAAFAHLNESESKEFYAKQVKSLLRTAMDGYGYIDYTTTHFVWEQVNNLLTTAQKHFENKNYTSAILICYAVMEQMTEALQFSDDSNGDIGGNIETAYSLLYKIASSDNTEEIRKQLLEYCLSTYTKNIFGEWDWHLGMLHLASQLIKTENEEEEVMGLLDREQLSEYTKEEAQKIRLQVILKIKGEVEAEKYIEVNLSNPAFRRTAIQKYLTKKSFEKAIEIAEDGIKYDIKTRPGLAYEWYDWLLNIAVAQNDKEKIIQYARLLFVDSTHEKKQYYQLMKTHVKASEWKIFIENIIGDLAQKGRQDNFYHIANIYINEQWWNRLLALIQQNKSNLSTIEQYEKYLSTDFTNEIIEMYEKGVIEYLKNNMGRDHYQSACRYMRRMIKLGAKEKVIQMISQFRTQYIQRRALMEELARI